MPKNAKSPLLLGLLLLLLKHKYVLTSAATSTAVLAKQRMSFSMLLVLLPSVSIPYNPINLSYLNFQPPPLRPVGSTNPPTSPKPSRNQWKISFPLTHSSTVTNDIRAESQMKDAQLYFFILAGIFPKPGAIWMLDRRSQRTRAGGYAQTHVAAWQDSKTGFVGRNFL